MCVSPVNAETDRCIILNKTRDAYTEFKVHLNPVQRAVKGYASSDLATHTECSVGPAAHRSEKCQSVPIV